MEHNNDAPLRAAHDDTRIDLDNPYEIRRWCQRFVCTEAALRAAVAKVGANPTQVRALVALGGRTVGHPPGRKPR